MSLTLKIGALTKLGLFFPVVCLTFISCLIKHSWLVEQLYRRKAKKWLDHVSSLASRQLASENRVFFRRRKATGGKSICFRRLVDWSLGTGLLTPSSNMYRRRNYAYAVQRVTAYSNSKERREERGEIAWWLACFLIGGIFNYLIDRFSLAAPFSLCGERTSEIRVVTAFKIFPCYSQSPSGLKFSHHQRF